MSGIWACHVCGDRFNLSAKTGADVCQLCRTPRQDAIVAGPGAHLLHSEFMAGFADCPVPVRAALLLPAAAPACVLIDAVIAGALDAYLTVQYALTSCGPVRIPFGAPGALMLERLQRGDVVQEGF